MFTNRTYSANILAIGGVLLNEVNLRIKSLRNKLGMTQEEFGSRIGLSKSGISNIEKGVRGISERHIKLICAMFNINESWLKTGEDSIEQLSNEIYNFDIINKYLHSIGYLVKVIKTGESESGNFEEFEDGKGNILGKPSWVPDEEYFSIIITKDALQVELTDDQFQEFQEMIKKSIEFELFKIDQSNRRLK